MLKRPVFLLFVIAACMLSGNAYAYSIVDNSMGGDCWKIGKWDWSSKTCTMTMDLTTSDGIAGNIVIDSNGITVDGNGHTLTGTNTKNSVGVSIHNKSSVTVRNLSIYKFYYGIRAEFSDNLYLENVETYSTSHNGIYFGNVQNSAIFSSTIAESGYGITIGANSNNNIVDGNMISANARGLYHCCKANGSTIRNNTFEENTVFGLLLYYDSYDNLVYNNNFINNPMQAAAYYFVDGNIFNLDAPVGGNYWSNFDTPQEGCFDTNGDGFCDDPYSYTKYGGTITDYLPLTGPVGGCGEVPDIEITSFTPEFIWPPNHKDTDITLTGVLTVPESCTLKSATYELLDEYGEYSSSGELVLEADNIFTLTVKVPAWRNGNDLDGRSYTVVLHASDEAGDSSSIPVTSAVPHDIGR